MQCNSLFPLHPPPTIKGSQQYYYLNDPSNKERGIINSLIYLTKFWHILTWMWFYYKKKMPRAIVTVRFKKSTVDLLVQYWEMPQLWNLLDLFTRSDGKQWVRLLNLFSIPFPDWARVWWQAATSSTPNGLSFRIPNDSDFGFIAKSLSTAAVVYMCINYRITYSWNWVGWFDDDPVVSVQYSLFELTRWTKLLKLAEIARLIRDDDLKNCC